MVELLALAVVVLFSVFLLSLGIAGFLAPALVSRFLLGFASSAETHFLEMAVRIVAGGAFILYAPATRFPTIFSVFGWLLIVTTAVLVLIPWRWHREFAKRTVPQALRHLPLLAVVSLVFGIALLYLAFAGTGQS